MSVRTGLGVLLALIGPTVGCQREGELQYTQSAAVGQLSAELQQQVRQQLDNYCGTPAEPKLLGNHVPEEQLKHGEAVFQQRFAQCHGVSGDGNGPAAEYLNPRPRDYRRGIFKFTSTPYGAKPRREDLVRVIREGATGTSMPAHRLLPDDDLQAVVDYVLALTRRGELEARLAAQAENDDAVDPESVPDLVAGILAQWEGARSQVVLPLTKPIPYSPESVEEGKKAFLSETAGCYKCHGPDGRGLKVAGENFKDAWGHPTRAADLSAGMFHGGNRPLDIYRRIYSGINGTPMPGFSLQLANQPDMFWHLVHYVQHVSEARRREVVEGSAKYKSASAGAPEHSE